MTVYITVSFSWTVSASVNGEDVSTKSINVAIISRVFQAIGSMCFPSIKQH